ncbi:FtsB family cell division protein [Desulfitibacter alkalitolerans]|uniref:FtsB family cell division protein n=1 Tax=Desulfitibacter alkalitolerans TaxID=264641 RepID=UPI00054E8B4A|nr:septum formation initiator family protein [Desulfitibacter alkalitolerans]
MNDNSNVIIHPRCLDSKRRINMELANKGQKRSNKLKPVFYISIVALLVFVLTAFGRFAWLSYKLDKEIKVYLNQLEEAKMYHAQLVQEVELAQDPIFIEKVARERLGLVKEGERVIMPAKPGYVMPLKKPVEGEIQH